MDLQATSATKEAHPTMDVVEHGPSSTSADPQDNDSNDWDNPTVTASSPLLSRSAQSLSPSISSRPFQRTHSFSRLKSRLLSLLSRFHAHTPYLRRLPLSAILIILLLVFTNLLVWVIVALVLSSNQHRSGNDNNASRSLLSTAALAYSLGVRHAFDADHISAIDLMTRRLVASGRRPVTVGTYFSLGHSTVVMVTSIVVAATAAGVSKRFDWFGTIGGIIGSIISAGFLILLGTVNAWVLWRLVTELKRVVDRVEDEQTEEEVAPLAFLDTRSGGMFFRVLKRLFKLIDRPWKMYPLGVMFGLGFDTSSEVALLGISSIQGAKGTSMWLILIFPVLFTAGMCLIDTIDGALMLSLYVGPMKLETKKAVHEQEERNSQEMDSASREADSVASQTDQHKSRAADPLTFLYYSTILTALTVVVAIVIGTLQLLALILNAAHPTGRFWDGVEAATGDGYEIIGVAICGSFAVVGVVSVAFFERWRKWVERRRAYIKSKRDEEAERRPVETPAHEEVA